MWLVWVNTHFATSGSCLLFGFLVPRTGRTSGSILMICMSYDVFPHKDVPFGGCIDTATHLGGLFAPKP